MEELEAYTLQVGVQNGAAALEVWYFLKNSTMKLPYDPPLPIPGIYPRETKTHVYKNVYKNLYVNILSRNVRKSCKVETAQMFTNLSMDI